MSADFEREGERMQSTRRLIRSLPPKGWLVRNWHLVVLALLITAAVMVPGPYRWAVIGVLVVWVLVLAVAIGHFAWVKRWLADGLVCSPWCETPAAAAAFIRRESEAAGDGVVDITESELRGSQIMTPGCWVLKGVWGIGCFWVPLSALRGERAR